MVSSIYVRMHRLVTLLMVIMLLRLVELSTVSDVHHFCTFHVAISRQSSTDTIETTPGVLTRMNSKTSSKTSVGLI